ncbi:ROK family transcriptional regulator [Streptomyces sp. NBC_01565]|uniref:ROK family transcriptional regulator n=1 Tax=unclassified Streptomyces TaxID=2593676 RepID=UPI00225C2477|nr:ROK family transcriptional regulator [Streptomyces sp. NBC_01565]MCX4543401.1 ROK family transcriptional regulator [Streptomyces sp. NBC_01565]
MNRANGEGRGVNLPALRGHNDALVLDLLRGAGAGASEGAGAGARPGVAGPGLGRSELAERTGLTPQAVSKITARLRAEGLVAEAGRGASTGGKPRTLLRLVPEARSAVGVHVDRDELRVVRVDLAGRVTADWRGPLDFGAGPGVVVDAVADAVVRTFAHPGSGAGPSQVLGVGIAAPGPLDWRTGVLGRVTGFPEWEGFPLGEELAGRLGVAVVVDKDTNAGAGAGAGAGGDFGASVYLHVGTGLGAGLRLNGEVYRGARSAAGEFGHQVLMLDGPPCRCGGRGCVEALCLDAVARGDLAEAARVLGEAAANLVALLDVDRVVLGGRVVEGAPGVFVSGVSGALAARGAGATVALAGRGVAEGAAELILAPFFGRSG